MKNDLIVILGPTASGKTAMACRLAAALDTEIISADSRQVFRGMDIGTGKDLNEYTVDGKQIPYHLIDVLNPGEDINIRIYQDMFDAAFTKVSNKGKVPILVGGSGLYIKAALEGLSHTSVLPDLALRNSLDKLSLEEIKTKALSLNKPLENFDFSTKKRAIRAFEVLSGKIEIKQSIVKNPIIFGIDIDVETRQNKIKTRLNERLNNGLIEEVENLLKTVPAEKLIYYGLEYKYITNFLQGDFDFKTLTEKLNIAIRQYAKRQMTFFRSMEKSGYKISWIHNYNELIKKLL